jgi:pimeloyl-ACP methyl ester carboxylesterase
MQSALQYALTEDGHRIAFLEHGSGEVLLIPGYGPLETIQQTTSFNSARHWYGSLAEDHRVVRIDLRGCGYSRHDDAEVDFSPQAWAQDIGAVVGALGVDRLSLFSVAGLAAYAIAFAADHPDLVARLVLTNPQDRLMGRNSTEFLVSTQQLAAADADLGIASAVRRFLGPEPDREHFIGLLATELAGMRIHSVADAAMANVYDVTNRLSEVRAATLILRMSDFDSITPDAERRLTAGIADARLVTLAGEGIFPWTGDIDANIAIIRSFLASTPG